MKAKYSVVFACLLIACLLIAFIPTNVYAAEVASGSCGENITWSLDDAGVLTVSGTGAMTDYVFDSNIQGTNAPWYSHKETITSVVVGEGITYVGTYAFMNLERVTSVSLPSTVVKIGGHSFQHLRLLTSIALPDSLEMIGEYAFYGCDFSELYLPNSLKTLSFYAISAAKVHIDTLEHWLDLELLPDTQNWISESAANPLAYNKGALYIGGELATDIVIPDGVTEISPYKFHQLITMTSITIPGSVTTIGEGAFWGCDGLTEITIPDTVTYLGNCVFMECENLTTAKLPSGLTNIPRRTFSGCAKLANFTLSESVTDIYESAFEGCSSLTHINETNSLENVRYIGSYAFVNCRNLQFGDLKLSQELYSLSAGSVGYSFAWCDGITGVTIPGSLYTVGGVAFENCANLERVTFEEGVHVLEGSAFRNCPKLTSVLLPKTVNTIDSGVFADCPNFTSIYILNKDCSIAEPITGVDGGVSRTTYPIGKPGVTTVYGHAGSTAEAYAMKYGYAFEELPKTCEYDFHTLTTTVTKEATCLTDGVQTIACSLCDYELEEVIYYPGHKIVNGVCEGCKENFVAYSEQKNGGFWALNTEGTLYLYNDADGGDITDAAWESYADQITKIMLASRVSHIVIKNGVESYVYYPNLTTIEFKGDILFYPSAYYAPNLSTFEFGADNYLYGVIDGVLYGDYWSDGGWVVAYPAGLPGTVLRLNGYVANNPLMKGNKIEKLYTAQYSINPYSYNKNNDSLTDIYFTNIDMFVIEETEQTWSESSFGDREKVTIHGYKGSRVEAIATELGYRFVELTECEINGHKTELVKKAATCVATGVSEHYACSVCGQLSSDKLGDYPVQADSLVVAVDKTNHTGKTEVKNTVSATCASEGYTGDTHCVDCGEKIASGTAIAKLDHKPVVKDAVAATCTAEGYTGDTYCTDCGEKIAGGSVIEKIAHTLTHHEAAAATCTDAGTVENWQCNVCKTIFADKDGKNTITSVTVPSLGHGWDEGTAQDGFMVHKCLYCDATKSLKLPPAGMNVGMPEVGGKLQSSLLTESEQKRVEQGEKLDIYLEVSDISESVTEGDKEKINEKLGDAKVGIYLDINLFKKVGNDRPSKISEPGENITISITVPLNLINTDALISREYRIIRIHNGVAEILKGVFDPNGNIFTFETDGFSTYVLTYQDTKLTTPATGDHADVLLWTSLIAFSMLSMATLVITKKRFF